MKLAFLSLLGAVAAKRDAYIYVMDGSRWSADLIDQYYSALANAGTTHIMASFHVYGQAGFTNGLADSVAVWAGITAAERSNIVSKLHQVGTKLLMVSGGGNYGTTYLNYDANTWADAVCGHAKENAYDGVDMDLEGIGQGDASKFIPWAIAASQRCHQYVNIVTHAPQSPYFHSAWGNAYDAVVDYVDKVLVQFYNQGAAAHADYQSTFVKDANWPTWQTIVDAHPNAKDKIVVGKYVYSDYGGSGMFTPDQFASAVKKAESELGYNAGIMLWRAPQPGETARYNQFINTDLPLMAGLNEVGTDAGNSGNNNNNSGNNNNNNGGNNNNSGSNNNSGGNNTNSGNNNNNNGGNNTNSGSNNNSGGNNNSGSINSGANNNNNNSGGGNNNSSNNNNSGSNNGSAESGSANNDADTSALVTYCKTHLGVPTNPAWEQQCHNVCEYYHSTPIFCGGSIANGEALVNCVQKDLAYCVRQ